VDDLRHRAQARRHREATPERDARVDDLRQRAQDRRDREATPEICLYRRVGRLYM